MNANLRKEIRIVLPIVAACSIVMCLGAAWHGNRGELLTGISFCAGCLLVGIRPFCAEFQHGTMALLCAQPVPRLDLWRCKRRVQIAGFLIMIVALFLAVVIGTWKAGPLRILQELYDVISWHPLDAGPFLLVVALPFLTGPFWSLLVRGTLAAGVFTVTGAMLATLPVLLWAEFLRPAGSGPVPTEGRILVSLLIYGFACWAFSRWHFPRMQLAGSKGGEIDLVGKCFQWFDRRPRRPHRTPQPAGWALFKKELCLQQVPLLVCALLLLTWGSMLLSDRLAATPELPDHRTEVNLEKYFGVLGLYVFLVPFLSGCTAFTEERAGGIHAWQITLPVSRTRQWLIKLTGLFTTNLVLGACVPGLLLWLFPDLRSRFDLTFQNPEVLKILVCYPGFLLLSVYVASLSRNTVQAVVAAVVAASVVPTLSVGLFPAEVWFQGWPQPKEPGMAWVILAAVLAPRLIFLSRQNFSAAELTRVARLRQIFGVVSLTALLLAGIQIMYGVFL